MLTTDGESVPLRAVEASPRLGGQRGLLLLLFAVLLALLVPLSRLVELVPLLLFALALEGPAALLKIMSDSLDSPPPFPRVGRGGERL